MLYIVLITCVVLWFSVWFKFMDNEQSYLLKNIDKIGVYLVVLVVTFMIFFVISSFDLSFKPEKITIKDESDLRSAYGALGDYFGGILNPIFGFFGLGVLLWTLRITRDEMRETKKALYNQETELLLARLSETFIKQCGGVNDHLDTLSTNFPRDSEVLPNRKTKGVEVIYDLSVMLLDISPGAANKNAYSVSIRDSVLMPNSRKIYNYSEALCSSLNMFVKTISLYDKELGKKEREQLFIIIEASLNYETTYYFMYVLHEANRFSWDTGMLFPYSEKLIRAKELMQELNKMCSSNMIDSEVVLQMPFEVPEWGEVRRQVDSL